MHLGFPFTCRISTIHWVTQENYPIRWKARIGSAELIGRGSNAHAAPLCGVALLGPVAALQPIGVPQPFEATYTAVEIGTCHMGMIFNTEEHLDRMESST